MDLLADERVARRPPVVLATLEALEALVPDAQRFVLQVDLNVARHVHLGRLPNQDREPDEVFGLLLAGVVEVLDPEVEDLLLGVHLGVLRPLPELGDELDVADGRLEVPVVGGGENSMKYR